MWILENNYEEQLRRFYNLREKNTFQKLVNSNGPRLSLSFQLFSKRFILPNTVFLIRLVSSLSSTRTFSRTVLRLKLRFYSVTSSLSLT